MSSRLSIDKLGGRVKLSERGEKNDGLWSSTDLLEVGSDGLELSVDLGDPDDDEDKYAGYVHLELSAYHVENEQTKRAFHSHLWACLDRRQTQELHAYLGYLLQHEMK